MSAWIWWCCAIAAIVIAAVAAAIASHLENRRDRRQAAADEQAIALTRHAPVTDPFLIALETELADMDRKIRRDLNG